MGALEAITLINALLTTATNTMIAAQKISILMQQAKLENRDISDEELEQLKAESEVLTQEAHKLFGPKE